MQLLPRLSLRSLLIGINLLVLALPLAGVQLLRLYESALVRQTESALIAQAAFVASFYRAEVRRLDSVAWLRQSRPLPQGGTDGTWAPRLPQLDLASSPRLDPFPDGVQADRAAAFARRVGEALVPVLKDAQLVTLAGIRVVDPDGVIVASTGDDVGLSIAHGEEVAQALDGYGSSRLRRKSDVAEVSTIESISRTTGVRVFVASPITLNDRLVGAVMLSRTPNNIVQALYGKRWLLLQAFALLVVIVLVLSVLTFRLIAAPVSDLVDQASRIARGDRQDPADAPRRRQRVPRTREFARLHQAITEMAQVLERRAAYLQEFSRHVSHEFKTPIASIRGAVEVLQDHRDAMRPEQFDRFLNNIEADAQRMQHLTQRLLELARADMQELQVQPVQVLPLLRASARRNALTLDAGQVPDGAAVASNPEALQAVLDVLMENAAQHGATSISARLQAGRLQLDNDGNRIADADRERIFEPFFTSRREQGGTGLGLSIARTLMRQTQGDLRLAPAAECTGFELQFPGSGTAAD